MLAKPSNTRSLKTANPIFLGLLLFFFFPAISAIAQEQPDYPNDENRNPYELNQTLDSHPNVSRENQRDSVVVKPFFISKPKSAEVPVSKQQTQEGPLSFNFLYYIIQKFKGSDVVE